MKAITIEIYGYEQDNENAIRQAVESIVPAGIWSKNEPARDYCKISAVLAEFIQNGGAPTFMTVDANVEDVDYGRESGGFTVQLDRIATAIWQGNNDLYCRIHMHPNEGPLQKGSDWTYEYMMIEHAKLIRGESFPE